MCQIPHAYAETHTGTVSPMHPESISSHELSGQQARSGFQKHLPTMYTPTQKKKKKNLSEQKSSNPLEINITRHTAHFAQILSLKVKEN